MRSPLHPLLSWNRACLAGLLGLCLAGTVVHAASGPTTEAALKAYQQGNFRGSFNDYSTLAKEKPDDPRLRFNAGAAAYRQNDLTNAVNLFETVVSAPDLKLQQQAYYNLGNTRFRLGETLPDPQQRQQLWQQAMTNFNSAMKLDAKDTNAAVNYAVVKQKLEELQQQLPPPQQQQNKPDKQDKKDQPQKQDPSKDQQAGKDPQDQNQDQSDKSDSQKQPPKPPGKDSGKQDGQENPPGDKKDPAKDGDKSKDGQKSGKDQKSEKPDPTSDGAQAGKGEDKDGKQPGAGEAAAAEAGDGKPGEMSAAQAVQLLENQKGDEKALMLRAYGSGKESAERAAQITKPW